jgi:hypothetical protein
MNTGRPTPQAVAQSIVTHLVGHPRAADTPAGIQRWWLAPGFGEVALQVVEQALAELESQGVVSRLDPSASQPTYGRGPRFGSGR